MKIILACLYICIVQIFLSSKICCHLTFAIEKVSGQIKNPFHKDKLRLLEASSSPIFGNSSNLNYYYVNLYIGSPPKRQSLIIDTGSQLTAVPCKPLCNHCGKHLNSYYDMSKSNSSKILECDEESCMFFPYKRCELDSKCGYSMVR